MNESEPRPSPPPPPSASAASPQPSPSHNHTSDNSVTVEDSGAAVVTATSSPQQLWVEPQQQQYGQYQYPQVYHHPLVYSVPQGGGVEDEKELKKVPFVKNDPYSSPMVQPLNGIKPENYAYIAAGSAAPVFPYPPQYPPISHPSARYYPHIDPRTMPPQVPMTYQQMQYAQPIPYPPPYDGRYQVAGSAFHAPSYAMYNNASYYQPQANPATAFYRPHSAITVNSSQPTDEEDSSQNRTLRNACEQCFKSKAACDFVKPCSRCVARGLSAECCERKSVVRHFGKPPASKSCVQCRKSRTRCENRRPCHNCVRRKIECVDFSEDSQSVRSQGGVSPNTVPSETPRDFREELTLSEEQSKPGDDS
jgi:hypothetical protein